MKKRIPYADASRARRFSRRLAPCLLLGMLAFFPARSARGQQPAPSACVTLTPTSLSMSESDGFVHYDVFLRLTTLAEGVSVYVFPMIAGAAANVQAVVSPAAVQFDADRVNNAQGLVSERIRVAVIPDEDDIGGSVSIAHSVSGPNCAQNAETVVLSIFDNGAPVRRVRVSETDVIAVEPSGAIAGQTAEYELSLSALPSSDVSIIAKSSDSLAANVSPQALKFTQDNWFEPQTLTVAALDDADGNDENVTISHEARGGDYDDVVIEDVDVRVVDPDPFVPTPAVNVSKNRLLLHEGQTTTYTITLATNPSEKVYVVPTPMNASSVTVSPRWLEFVPGRATPDNALSHWSTPRVVRVETLQDEDDLSERFMIEHLSLGGDYAGISVSDVDVTIWDDEARGVTLSESEFVIEEGKSAEYEVRLDAFPLNTVTIALTSSAPDKLSVSPETLRFEPNNAWHLPQTVTLTARRDADMDADAATVAHRVSGGGYDSVTVPDVTATIPDTGVSTSVEDAAAEVPTDFALEGNYPNPFNPTTAIAYALPKRGHVTLIVYDASGREVRRLVDATQAPGRYRARWDGKDAQGRSVRSGVYFYRLATDAWRQTQSMVLLK